MGRNGLCRHHCLGAKDSSAPIAVGRSQGLIAMAVIVRRDNIEVKPSADFRDHCVRKSFNAVWFPCFDLIPKEAACR